MAPTCLGSIKTGLGDWCPRVGHLWLGQQKQISPLIKGKGRNKTLVHVQILKGNLPQDQPSNIISLEP